MRDPAVLTWRIALAPLPRFRVGSHWWHRLVMDTFRTWTDAWEAEAERVSIGYDTELAEFAARKPRPTLKRVLVGLSSGGLAPGGHPP